MDTSLTGEDVVKLYKKHGLKPRTKTVDPTDGGCCLLGILVVDKGGLPDCLTNRRARKVLSLTYQEWTQIVNGFDYGYSETPLEAWAAGIRRAVFRDR